MQLQAFPMCCSLNLLVGFPMDGQINYGASGHYVVDKEATEKRDAELAKEPLDSRYGYQPVLKYGPVMKWIPFQSTKEEIEQVTGKSHTPLIATTSSKHNTSVEKELQECGFVLLGSTRSAHDDGTTCNIWGRGITLPTPVETEKPVKKVKRG